MYAQKKKKDYPPGTFIPTPARLMAIAQLCLAFTAIFWTLGYPFMGRHFELKSKLVVFEHVISSPFFNKEVPQNQEIIQEYDRLKQELEAPFFDKISISTRIFLYDIPLLEKVWMLLAVILSIMALKKQEGVKHAVWILPLLVLAYSINNHMHGTSPSRNEEAKLFPTEEILLKDYLREPLKEGITDQQIQLLKGWELYLVQEWAKELVSSNPEKFQQQIKRGDFAFSVARINSLFQTKENYRSRFHAQQPMPLLIVYFCWNLLFAWVIWKRSSKHHL